MAKRPLDDYPYEQDSRVRELTTEARNGTYVYVKDLDGEIYVLPDGPHLHPKLLGGGKPALYAGDMTVESGGIIDITNLSGTFQFDDEDGLLKTAKELIEKGFVLDINAIRFFPMDGSRPRVLYLE